MDSSGVATCLRSQSNTGEGSIQAGNSTSPNLPYGVVQQQRPVYTTAGTVWNPESARPIRAPVRRGRASLGSTGGEQFPVASQQDGTNALHSLAASAVVPHYAPLQQNNDRAINPHVFHLAHRGDPSPNDMASFRAGGGPLPTQASDTMLTQHNPRGDAAANHGGGDDDGSTNLGDAFVEKLPMKSLVSLASYENPYQQKAQHVLRVKSNPGLPSGGVPTAFRSSHEAVGLSTSHQPRSLATTPNAISSQPTQVDVRPLGDYASALPKTQTNSQLAHPRQSRPFLSSALATGPGAPEPLKAGPPGQRQQGPSKIESTFVSNLHAAGVNTAQPVHPIHSTQPLRPYSTLNMTNGTDGLGMTGPSPQIPTAYYSHDGVGSDHDHPSLHTISRTAAGEGPESEMCDQVITPAGFVRHGLARSNGNSGQSARLDSDGAPVHQPSTYNFIPDQGGHDTHPLADRGLGFNDALALARNNTRFDLARQILEARRAMGYPGFNEAPSINSYELSKSWANENLGSNILQSSSVDGNAGSVSSHEESRAQLSTTTQAVAGSQSMSTTRDPYYWIRKVENLDPYDWDPAQYHQPYHGRYPHGATKMDGEMLRERDAKINAWFYSNTSRLGKTMGQVLEERKHSIARPSPFGAIGDGRPKPEKKQTYAHISIDEANEMPASDHAKPLLNLVFQAILDHKDTEEAREFADTSGRKANKEVDCGEQEELDKLGSAVLVPGSVCDAD
ncbi:uncharacterized protein DNG_02976 [Cephalotrichum gorgonifer]|uniref:Uncharacterized protein n=1 Tax=Cephalotrichum gorgonifer TaxID=2041049 RepID=A0AAE8MTE1_9PEZI|nr:uncharacterized protein DNG_02976 [Cephalotrichum gorgonifer]